MLIPIDVVFDSTLAGTAQVTGTQDQPIFTLQPAIENCVGVSLIYASVPFTYYVIDQTNNEVVLRFLLNGNVAASYLLQLELGSYTSVEISQVFYDAIRVFPEFNVGYDILTFEVDQTTTKLRVWLANELVYNGFRLDFAATERSCHDVFGFEKKVYTAAVSPFVTNNGVYLNNRKVINAPRVVNLTGPNQMYLKSSFAASLHGSVRNQISQQQLLAFWPVNVNYGGIIDVQRENPPMIPVSKQSISTISFSLAIGNRQQYGHSDNIARDHLSLNGEGFQVALRFWTMINEEQTRHNANGDSVVEMLPMQSHQNFHPLKPRQMVKQIANKLQSFY